MEFNDEYLIVLVLNKCLKNGKIVIKRFKWKIVEIGFV